MHELKNNLPGGSDKRFANQINSFLEKNKYTFNIADVSSYFQRKSFPINKGYSVPDKVSRLWDKIHKELQRLCEMEAPALFNCYIDIFNPVFSNFKALSKKDDVLFLEELNRQAKGLFDEEYITVPELYYRLATRFRHYLIDEFQDTSTLQWRNIFPMVQEAISTGGSLFYVGDKKQAIYRFRGGDVSLFDKIKQEFKAYNLKEEHLLKNYRSHKEIIEFNNTLFSKDNLSRFIQEKNNYEATRKNHFKIFSDLDIKEVLAVFRDSEQSYRQEHIGGYVKVEFMDALSREETHLLLEDKLISLIKDLKKRFTYKDIAILTRKNEEVKLITEWLIKNDIAVESEKTLNIRAHPLVKELVSFLKFLHSPIDNLAFASFILGDIFSRAAGLDQQKMQDFVFQFRCANLEENSYLYRQFRTKFTQTWDNFIEEFFKNVGFIPLYELVISIMDRFCILKNFFEYQGFFMKFLELIKTQEEENASPFAFLEYFSQAKDEDLYVNVADTDSVKVLTIHKAKGLEFGVVILPLLEMELEVGPSILQSKDNLLELLHWQNTYVDFSSQLKAVYQQEYKKAFIDELNNIYVALTRAKQELYIFIPPRGSRGFNYVNLLIPKDNSEKGKQIDYPKTQLKNKIYLIEPSPSEYKDWIVRLKEEFIPVSQIKNRAEILKGEILHYILSFIGNLFGRNVNEVIQKALEKAHFAFSLIKDWQYYQEMMQKICAKEQFKPFFFIEQGMVYQEKEIVDKFGLTKRIDRLIVKPEEVIIIDYKSAKEFSEEYAAQIKEYIKIIKDIYTAQKVRGILLYLDDFTMEEIDG
jgi:ATP-dependent exoDNAse (exonuclease V) beta subunit